MQPAPSEAPTSQSTATPEGLRQRRNRETRTAIHLAALALIERDGLAHTTVAAIAAHAGVSPRTFFRYFPNKEQAALPGQHRLLETLRATAFQATTPQQALTETELLLEVFLAEESTEIVAHQRVLTLLAGEPSLRAHAAVLDLTVIEEIAARIHATLPQDSPEIAHMIAETSLNVWRQSWARWVRLSTEAPHGQVPTPQDCYAAVRAELRLAFREPGSATVVP